jgi:hypothetical protein
MEGRREGWWDGRKNGEMDGLKTSSVIRIFGEWKLEGWKGGEENWLE